MSKKARSARGEIVDFDLLSIKQQLATVPVNAATDTRRKFIDEKDRVQTRTDTATLEVPSALLMAAMSADASAEAAAPAQEPEARAVKQPRAK